jgi:SAM-dependent methyltransferase
MKLVDRFCPLCGSNTSGQILVKQHIHADDLGKYAFSSQKIPEFMHYQMVVCPNCDLAYANPVPDIQWIQDEYVSAAFDADEESQFGANDKAKVLHRILPNLPDRNRALDVGTGNGAFLLKLQEAGFDEVFGVEPSPEPIRQAQDSIRPLIERNFFDGNNYEPATYSLITCFGVLEHVYDIKALTQSVFRMLKPGGVFLTSTHDYRCFSAKVLGHRSPIFDIEHLQLFSRYSLSELYKRCEFSNIHIHPMSNNYPIWYWLKIAPLNPRIKKWIGSTIKVSRTAKVSIRLSAGNMWALGYRLT